MLNTSQARLIESFCCGLQKSLVLKSCFCHIIIAHIIIGGGKVLRVRSAWINVSVACRVTRVGFQLDLRPFAGTGRYVLRLVSRLSVA